MWKWWIGKTTALHVRHTFLYLSLPSLHDYDRREKAPNFTFYGGREEKKTTFFFFSWTLIQSFRVQVQKNLPTFDKNWTRWSKREKVWSSANALFKWLFRSRRRRCCWKLPYKLCTSQCKPPYPRPGNIEAFAGNFPLFDERNKGLWRLFTTRTAGEWSGVFSTEVDWVEQDSTRFLLKTYSMKQFFFCFSNFDLHF